MKMKKAVILSAILAALSQCVSAAEINNSSPVESRHNARFAPVDGGRFIASLTSMNWFAAYGFCNQQNATLLSLELGKDDIKKKEFINFINLYHLQSRSYWLYGSRLEDDVTFRWGLGGLPLSHTDWSAGQPDNLGGQQRCLKLFKSFEWDDEDCYAKFYAACQKY